MDNRFLASVVDGAVPRREVAVLVAVVPVVVEDLAAVVVRGLLVLVVVAVAGLRAAAVVFVGVVLVFDGLDSKVLVRRDEVEVVDFFSSSLALTLGRLRWLVALELVVGRFNVLLAAGRVSGLVVPAVAVRVVAVPVVLAPVVVVVVPGRRVAVVELVLRRFDAPVVAVLAAGLALVAGEAD